MTMNTPAPTRDAALARLDDFVPKAGRAYATGRNHDLPGHPHVSGLSPYIRHRLISEEEVLQATLAAHSFKSAEKFIQEVYWRTYWKGWLEMRPSVWATYRAGLTRALDRVHSESGLRADWEAACRGETGIAPFDHWAQELAATGYLHNHARMWFASIWIFTLRLPWELGADFFLRHLLDGDPASNTLGWRWVAGLQTPGKVYAARSSNITKFTDGRFGGIHGLAQDPAPVDGAPNPPRGDLPPTDTLPRTGRIGLLITEEDMTPGWLLDAGLAPDAIALVQTTSARSPLHVAQGVHDFVSAALDDTATRLGGAERLDGTDGIADWAAREGLDHIVTPWLPTGPTPDALRPALAETGLPLHQIRRAYDSSAWPYATAGFFKFKDKIPKLIGQLGGLLAV